MQSLSLFLALLLGASCLLHASQPDAQTIVQRMIARDDEQQQQLKSFEYDQEVLIEKIDSKNRVKETERLFMRVSPGKGGFTLVANSDGAALLPNQVSEEKHKAAKESEKLKANFSLRKLADRFDVEIEQQTQLLNQPCYLLRFQPKREPQPYNDRIEKILNHLSGHIWIATSDYTILQTRATLTRPVDLAWFFATMESMQFNYLAQPIPGTWGPEQFEVAYHVSVFLGAIRQKQTMRMSDFQRVAQ